MIIVQLIFFTYFCSKLYFIMVRIKICKDIPEDSSVVLLATRESCFDNYGLSDDEASYVKAQIDAKSACISLNKNGRCFFVQTVDTTGDIDKEREKIRCNAFKLHQNVTQQKIKSLAIVDTADFPDFLCAFAESMALSNYQFLKYTGKKEEKKFSLRELTIVGNVDQTAIDRLNVAIEAVYKTRDLVNEPGSIMTSARLAAEFEAMGKEAGLDVQVFDKTAIEEMKMGGLLAVNRGSVEFPTFTVLEWKPAEAKNERPIILVGKGLTYDTGGNNLKTGDYMNDMKSDMAGGAAVAATVQAIAKAKIPLHVIALIPSTDNRISANAISPGDVITMYDGTTVEVANTDAEGRLILADALVFAKKYNPELVITMATLTGAASRAVGDKGIATMGKASQETMERLKKCGEYVRERIVEFPLWEEYGEELESDVADLKNIGSENAGMITAGKFLEHFTSYPFIHLDIAGVAFAKSANGYRGKGGTGVGVRLLLKFLYEK